jgi:predicted nucleic acid-binding protein
VAAGLRILLDTSSWIAFLRGEAPWDEGFARQFFSENDILLADLVYIEILRGAQTTASAKLLDEKLNAFEPVSIVDFKLAKVAIDHHRHLRTKGVTLRGTIDLIIATWCISNAVPLMHADRDFAGFEQHLGLKVWRSDRF